MIADARLVVQHQVAACTRVQFEVEADQAEVLAVDLAVLFLALAELFVANADSRQARTEVDLLSKGGLDRFAPSSRGASPDPPREDSEKTVKKREIEMSRNREMIMGAESFPRHTAGSLRVKGRPAQAKGPRADLKPPMSPIPVGQSTP